MNLIHKRNYRKWHFLSKAHIIQDTMSCPIRDISAFHRDAVHILATLVCYKHRYQANLRYKTIHKSENLSFLTNELEYFNELTTWHGTTKNNTDM
jgi:hypothetical protein